MPNVNDLFGPPEVSTSAHHHHHSASAGSSPNVELQMLRHHQSQSNPQLSSSPAAASLVPLANSQMQRHSTGNLAAQSSTSGKPTKGILKRPHTFHSGSGRRKSPASNAKKGITPTFDQRPWPSGNRKVKRETPSAQQEPATKTVEFTDKNTIAVFGDTTTDTEGGGAESNNAFAQRLSTRKNTTAVVSPVVRKPDQGLKYDDIGREVTPPSEEGTENGSTRSGMSHIVGKWWFGKSTKFVVHCDRRGCKGHGHGHSSRESTPIIAGEDGEQQRQVPAAEPEEPYLTPTQRRQREITALKKELRRAQLSCREKERHLGQLKERLDEIERLMASSSGTQMVQCAQLRQRLAEREEEFGAEREALIARHEHRMRQLNQEMMDMRTELARKEKIITDRERLERRDQAVQVDTINDDENGAADQQHSPAPLSPSLVPATALGWTPPDKTTTEYAGDVPFGGEERQTLLKPATTLPTLGASKSAPVSPCKGPQNVQVVGADVMATLEAYRSETVVWRTRTAQLELILQDLLLREGVRNARGEIIVTTKTLDMEGTQEGTTTTNSGIVNQQESPNVEDGEEEQMKTKELAQQQTVVVEPAPPPRSTGECQLVVCVERRSRWAEEEARLTARLAELNIKNTETESELDRLETQLSNLKAEHAELAELAEKRLCEVKAIQITLNGTEKERERLEQAVAYLERRCHVMEQIGLDQGIVLVEIDDFRRAPGDVFTFRGSKATQTSLTTEAVLCNERELDELQIKIRAMQITFAEDKAQMGDQLKEIDNILRMKTELVTQLTDQLEEAAIASREEDERHQRERDTFSKKVEMLGRVAERVPILESELEKVRVEKSHCELRLKSVQEAADEQMEHALDRAMRKTKQAEEYWAERQNAVERHSKELETQLEGERKGAADARMRWAVERAELDRRLQSAIEHLAQLNARVNCPRRDAQVDVRPRTSSKYVVCRPNQHDKATGAELRDAEMEELREEISTLEEERRWMQMELGRMEREMAERIQERRMGKRKTTMIRKGLPELTVSFHRGSDAVELGGRVFSSAEVDHEQVHSLQLLHPADACAISMVSLPAVLHDSEASDSFTLGHGQMLQRSVTPTTTENEPMPHQSPREFSLPLLTVNGKNQQQQNGRCHSAPRTKQQNTETEEERVDILSMSVEPAEPEHVGEEIVTQEMEKFTTKLRGQVQQLRERVQELMAAAERRGSTESAQREARLDELFSQLECWMYAMISDGEIRAEMRRKCENLQMERDRLRAELKDALAELEVYRTEPRRDTWERRMDGGKRSASAEQLGHGGRPPLAERQLRRWKEIAGTTFREVNHLRKRLTNADEERRRQRNQLAILRGELTMAKCQHIHRQQNFGGFAGREQQGRRGSVDRGRNGQIGGGGEETLDSYNRWLGGDRWQSVPDLDEEITDDQQKDQRRKGRRRDSTKEAKIVMEALKRQLGVMKVRMDQMAQSGRDELEGKEYELKKVQAESELLRRENIMYEQKCVDMDRERQQMYLIMFRKGQQAANMEKREEEEELDKASELQVVMRFLHDAFFYYLLNKGNAREHLQAIMTMLNFTAEQKEQVYKRRGKSH